jgi:AcrR family transcriptional regulator
MSPSKKQLVTQFRTSGILQAARRVFGEKGYERATIDDIARAAGVAKGTVYLYYRSKRDVYWESLQQGILELRDDTVRRMNAARTLEETVRAFVTSKLEYFEEHKDFFKIYQPEFRKALVQHTSFQKQLDGAYLEQVRLLELAIRRAARTGAIRSVRSRPVAFAVFDITWGLITQRLRGWSDTTIDQDVSFAVDLLWKGMTER